ncbi:hypothetical protein BE11_09925 [Sorangium cellulosum]|nr:hypothetical protein BE11_09925 [Sorangium cellulosum]
MCAARDRGRSAPGEQAVTSSEGDDGGDRGDGALKGRLPRPPERRARGLAARSVRLAVAM